MSKESEFTAGNTGQPLAYYSPNLAIPPQPSLEWQWSYDAPRDRTNYWAVIFGLEPFEDANQWCVKLGNIIAYGKNPEQAIINFDYAMSSPEGVYNDEE